MTIKIIPTGVLLPYTSDMKAVRERFQKSQIRFDVTSMKIDDEEYKDFDLIVAAEITQEAKRN